MRKIHLARFLIEQQRSGHFPAEVAFLVEQVARASTAISHSISRGALGDVLGSLESENVQGEVQKKLDVIANDIFIQFNEWGGHLAALASEEMDTIYPVPDQFLKGEYLLLFDPLDGSSNVDVNLSVGSIFSVLKAPVDAAHREIREEDFLQPGREQVAAGYAIYGPQTMLVLSMGTGIHGFTLDRETGSFVLTHHNMSVPERTREYAINASYRRHWPEAVKRYVEDCETGSGGPLGQDYNMRWTASMVADVHRVLTRGGVFLYPEDARPGMENGKLRLLYEGNPMAYLVEQAGGRAYSNGRPILDVQPTTLHQRVPVMLGSAAEIERMLTEYDFGGAGAPASRKP